MSGRNTGFSNNVGKSQTFPVFPGSLIQVYLTLPVPQLARENLSLHSLPERDPNRFCQMERLGGRAKSSLTCFKPGTLAVLALMPKL